MKFSQNLDSGGHSGEALVGPMLLPARWSSSVDHGREPWGITVTAIFVDLILFISDTENGTAT